MNYIILLVFVVHMVYFQLPIVLVRYYHHYVQNIVIDYKHVLILQTFDFQL